jgi:hypothetical protein
MIEGLPDDLVKVLNTFFYHAVHTLKESWLKSDRKKEPKVNIEIKADEKNVEIIFQVGSGVISEEDEEIFLDAVLHGHHPNARIRDEIHSANETFIHILNGEIKVSSSRSNWMEIVFVLPKTLKY